MPILFLTDTYPPYSLGGTGATIASLARAFARSGRTVWVLVSRKNAKNGIGAPPQPDAGTPGVAYNRNGQEGVLAFLERISPAKVVATGRTAANLQLGGVSSAATLCLYLQDPFSELVSDADRTWDCFVFASRFLKSLYEDRYAVTGNVIPPLVERSVYEAIESRRTNAVSFGLSRVKRPDIVFAAAGRLPNVDFDIFHTWGTKYRLRNLPLLLRPNLHLFAAVGRAQLIFGNARVILVPSEVEGWCRVVTEGQFAGIPTIARGVGALPESVGKGGRLLPAEATVEDWIAEIGRVFHDEDHYTRLVEAARAASRRQLIAPEHIVGQWADLIDNSIKDSDLSC